MSRSVRPNERLAAIGLRPRIMLAVSAFSLLVFGLFLFVATRIMENSAERTVAALQKTAETSAADLDRTIDRVFLELEATAESGNFEPAPGDTNLDTQPMTDTYRRTTPLLSAVTLSLPSGETVAREPTKRFTVVPDEMRASILAVAATGSQSISHAFLLQPGDTPTVAFSIPVRNAEGKLVSVMTGLVNLGSTDIGGAVQRTRGIGETGHGELVGGDGLVLVSVSPDSFGKPGEYVSHLNELGDNWRDGVTVIPQGGRRTSQDHITITVPLQSADWVLVAGVEAIEVFGPIQAILQFAGKLEPSRADVKLVTVDELVKVTISMPEAIISLSSSGRFSGGRVM